MPDELSPSQAAAQIGATTRSVQRWIASGRLPARRVGGRWRVASDAIDAFASPTRFVATQHPGARAPAAPTSPPGPIRTLFVANRGEIAQRITRTCDRLGIRAVVPPTDGPAALDLLDAEAVVMSALAAGADAIHPGFGFLAENADFAERAIAANIRWVGPPPAAIRAMGDKAAARRLAASLGIPVLEGYDDEDQTDPTMTAAADGIGYPLLVKPTGGGGGKGMRIVHEADRLPEALAAARREAVVAFGDDRLILERLVEGARHVEVQVLFDAAGEGVHLGERDCSIQRRHQKVLEEAPSPAVDAPLRARLGEAALSLARAVKYVSAGTCEFLLDDRGSFTFMEMNTRLQVEHPVTELVTGRDLVADQLRIAAGEPLGFTQADVAATGHAIEVRLYAEDAEAGFLPATGRIERLRWPSGDGVRVDAGVVEGDEVGSRFDPMLAKIVARGSDRGDALDRLTRALDETVVLGLTTNLRFLRWLVRQEVVLDGQVRTNTLDRIWPPDDWAVRVDIPDAAWSTAAAMLLDGGMTATTEPWLGGWRLNASPSIRLTAGDATRSTAPSHSNAIEAVRVDSTVHVDVGGRSVEFAVAPPPDVDRAARAAAHTRAAGPADLVAPMPGTVIAIHAAPGDAVQAGDPIVTLEAMKMEHAVAAPIAGRLTEVLVLVGDQVERATRLAVVEP